MTSLLFEGQILSFQSGMLTAQTETLFSLQKSLLAGRAEMNAE